MFRCSLSPGDSFDVAVLERDGEFLVQVTIGYDPEEDLVFSLVVMLAPLPGYADLKGYELSFVIIKASLLDDTIVEWWDGRESRASIRDEADRRLVRGALYATLPTLIDAAKPGLVEMTTHSANLPERALDKFNDIAAIFRDKGFTAGRADSWHGHYIWMMKRPD